MRINLFDIAINGLTMSINPFNIAINGLTMTTNLFNICNKWTDNENKSI